MTTRNAHAHPHFQQLLNMISGGAQMLAEAADALVERIAPLDPVPVIHLDIGVPSKFWGIHPYFCGNTVSACGANETLDASYTSDLRDVTCPTCLKGPQ